jgi:hypothetical protein
MLSIADPPGEIGGVSMPALHKHSRRLPEPVPVTLKDLILSMDGINFDALLAEWRWLVDDNYSPVLLTVLGDLFLEAPNGSIYRLQTGEGDLDWVAGSRNEFEQLMGRQDKIEELFSPKLVGMLKAQGMELGPGQCYGYMNPPCLGGRNEPLNLEPADLYVHFSILGQIGYQICDLPVPRAAEVEPEN